MEVNNVSAYFEPTKAGNVKVKDKIIYCKIITLLFLHISRSVYRYNQRWAFAN